MKTTLITFLFLIPFLAIGKNDKKEQKEENPTQKEKQLKKRRYRLDDKTKNFFSIDDNRIYIEVPVTSNKLRMTNYVKNISSDKINAILVWIKADVVSPTPCEGDFLGKERRIRISKLKGLREQLEDKNNKKLLVVFFIDQEEPTYKIENDFREMVRKSESYEEAVVEANKGNCNDENKFYQELDFPFKPAESGGDVIGGNE